MLTKIIRLFRKLAGKETANDRLKSNIKKWKRDKGDITLRFSYPLTANSLVWDVGGYCGDFADEIQGRYQCKVVIFEPMPEFYNQCVERFKNNSQVKVESFGLSDKSGKFPISPDKNATSFVKENKTSNDQFAELKSVIEYYQTTQNKKIDLIKINIEGGEYDLIPELIKSEIITQIENVQIQFHDFVEDAISRRQLIREQISRTHREEWNYDFVWESWTLKK